MKRVFLWAVVAFFCMTTANAGNRDHSADLQQVCQLVLDHPDLQGFYHSKLPGRVPVTVSDHLIGKGLKLSKFGKPVVFVSDPDKRTMRREAILRFDKVKVDRDEASVEFSYPIEGVFGQMSLEKQGGKWRVISARVLES